MLQDNKIIKELLTLNLPTNDYAVFGSGPMFVHGIKDLVHDIDLVARGKAWKMAKELGDVKDASLGGNKVVALYDGDIEIFNGWAPGDWDIDELIDSADTIDGIKFVSLGNVVKWKKIMGRDKDIQHIHMIEDYLARK